MLVNVLHQHLQDSLKEYVREKHRRQISRLSFNVIERRTSTEKVNMIETPKRLLTRSQAANYRPSLARSMSNIGLGRMDDIEENDDESLGTAPASPTLSSSSVSSTSIEHPTISRMLDDEPKKKLYANALSDIL